ncbi:sigma-70 family RNA polymerase sigma factor [Calidifontibacter sp. DB0510]|uniref:Sigma-70 family RNA polymerase sigma factor n=1 Tax=Metallococcus carri TaxID=1656884 RepID=A0A967AXP8_9MICO|nr:sigma-70 family RNA polymerase sigma factor [Metallococcus carri]NHN54653.1 sigma-70 family RNA polymerase sigma factor [Metallococcus carri]NOP36998.1 sigma-70 family RNA polymerase sigma factor [Calidifontibacter sp. DB2511S]
MTSLPTSDDLEDRTLQLLRTAQATDPADAAELRDRVVLMHRPMALRVAHRFEGRGVEADDLRQVALLGLVLAVNRFRPETGYAFAAYAIPTISGELKRYFRDHGWAVRPPRAVQETRLSLRAARPGLEQRLGRAPDAGESAAAVGRSAVAVRAAEDADRHYRWVSLDAPVSDDTSGTLGDTLTDSAAVEAFNRVELRIFLQPAVARLETHEREILRLRFGENLTQREIGQQIGASQMQVSRLLAAIFEQLRRELTAEPAPAGCRLIRADESG